jgi:hypothetical protein
MPWDIFEGIIAAFHWLVDLLITGFLDAIGSFFYTGLEVFLFFRNPRFISPLNWYWERSLIIYLFVVIVMMFAYYVVLMLLADSESADVQRIVQRLIVSAFFVFISRDAIGFFVALTHGFSRGIHPSGYSFHVALDMLEAVTVSAGAGVTALFIAVAGGLGIFITGLIFYIVLAMRMLIVYGVYAISPVLLGFWVVDVGPGKYGKSFAELLFKIFAVMMVLGIIISSVLAVGSAFSNPADMGVELASDYTAEGGTVIIQTNDYGPRSQLSGSAQAGELQSDSLGGVIFRIFMFLGTIWLLLGTVTSLFGMLLSTGVSPPGGSGGSSGNGSRGDGSSGQPWGAEYQGNTTGTAHAYQTPNGNTAIVNPAGGGVVVNPDGPDGQAYSTFGPEDNPLASAEAPANPFNTAPETSDAVTLSEKADYLTSGKLSSTQEAISEAGGKTKEFLGQQGIAGKAATIGGTWAKRAGKATYNVSKQPTVGASLEEAHRIAQESPIGKPQSVDEYDGAGDGVTGAAGVEAFEMARTANPSTGDYSDETVTKGSGTGVGGTGDGVGKWNGSFDNVGDIAGSIDVSDVKIEEIKGSVFQEADWVALSESQQERFLNQLEKKYGTEAVEKIQNSIKLRKENVEGGLSELQGYANQANAEDFAIRDENASFRGGEVTEKEVAAFREMQKLSQEFLRENYTNADGKVELYRGLGEQQADVIRQAFDDPSAAGYDWPNDQRSIGYTTDRDVAEKHNHGGGVVREEVEVEDVDIAMDHVTGESVGFLKKEQEVIAKNNRTIAGDTVEIRGRYSVLDLERSHEVSGPAQKTIQKVDRDELDSMSDAEHETIMAGISSMREAQNAKSTDGLETQEGVNRIEKWKRYAEKNFPDDYDAVVEDAEHVIGNAEHDPDL